MADSFSGVLAFAFLAFMILVGTALRANIRFFQTSLMPASLIGGILGFVCLSFGILPYSAADFLPFAFHFFTLSFMALVLTGAEPTSKDKSIKPGGLWFSVGWTMSRCCRRWLVSP